MQNVEPRPLRLFIALPLPEKVKDAIEKAQMELRGALPESSVRWTKREQFHLTLKFLGNVEEQRVESLTTALQESCDNFSPLQLCAGRIGFFPDARRPRIIWTGVRDAQEQLPPLQRAVETAAADFTGEDTDEEFSGHVTLGRVKKIQRKESEMLAQLASSMAERSFGEWNADTVEVIRSELSSAGARYTTLAKILLQK